MTFSPPPPPTNQSPTAPVTSTLVWGATGFLSLGPLMMSMMLFDAPGSENNKILWLVVAAMASYPFFCAISVIGSWIAYSMGAGTRTRRILLLLPLSSVALFIISIALWIGLCNGQTRCH